MPRLGADPFGVSRRLPVFTLARHLFAIAVLRFTLVVVVPCLIAGRFGVAMALGNSAGANVHGVGAAAIGLGLLLAAASVWRFATEGNGAFAPWDPPRRFVTRGPCRHVRNPMISGVVLILFGEAIVMRSAPHGAWAVFLAILNLVHVPIVEESRLERRFGESYRDYCRQVRRFIPSPRPWRERH
jgi:protein-S-isoprenylcysteine O-methyltransferase Ste14